MSKRIGARNAYRGFLVALFIPILACASCVRTEKNALAVPAQHPPNPASAPDPVVKSFTVLACGDILLSRTPGKRAAENGYQYLFAGVRTLVSQADVSFANLETPASYLGSPYPGKPPNVTFRADPATLFGLAWAGFDVVSLANNHMNDYGPRAIAETLDFLDLLGIARSGAGRDFEEAHAPAVLERDGVRFAFLSYAEPIWSVIGARSGETFFSHTRAETPHYGPMAPSAGPVKPSGTPGVALASMAEVIADIRSLKETLKPDYLFVSIHWGEEHQHVPNAFQRALGRAAIDAGASAVLGHHPHVLQTLERHGGGLIVYSLGNFVFDMASTRTYESMALRLHLSNGKITHVDIIPISIQRGSYAPVLASEKVSQERLADIARWSPGLGDSLRIKGSNATLFF